MVLARFLLHQGIENRRKNQATIGSKTIRNWGALSKAILKGFWSIFDAILGPKMEPTSKKNGIKNKSDFKTKL